MIGEKIFCGLDFGSQKIKTSLLRVKKNDELELLGVFETPLKGFKNTSVNDAGDVAESVAVAINGLVQNTGFKIKEVQLGIGGDLIESRRTNAIIPLLERGNKVITPHDLKAVNQQAASLGIKPDEEILHDIPQHYKVDEANITLNPTGTYGRKLEADLLLLLANTMVLNPIIKAVNQAGFEVSQTLFSTFAAATATLTDAMKIDGCALIDIGCDVTHILIFKDALLRFHEKIPLGGHHITRSIAQHLNLPFDLAEDIKRSYGAAIDVEGEKDEEILVKKDSGYLPIKREVIYEAIEPEISKLVARIENAIKGPFYTQLTGGVTIVGGGSLLPGLLERIEKSVSLTVIMGKNQLVTTRLNNAALFSGSIGLAQLGLTKIIPYSVPTQPTTHWLADVSNKLKEIYQEYF